MNIISASRRTDIPAFYADWFINRLKEGYLFVKNPYSGRYSYVSLRPEDLLGIVFWSKNFSPLLSRLEEVEKVKRNLFFHFTITGMSKEIEINALPYHDAISDLLFLSKRYSPDHIIWRFDPICITDRISFDEHLESFIKCADLLKGNITTCYISFVNPYTKVLRNFARSTNHKLLDPPVEEKRRYSRKLADMAKRYNIRLFACCNDYLLSDEIFKAGCIDINYLSGIWGSRISWQEKPSPTRKECACTKSIDIGAYDTCSNGCIYCYANMDKERAVSFWKAFNPDWNSLDVNIGPSEISQALGQAEKGS